MRLRLWFSLLLLGWLPLLPGCAGYHLGAQKPAAFQSIHTVAVPNFKNLTLEPRLESLTANALIRQIQQDGTYRVTAEGDADAIVQGTVQQLVRTPLRGSGRDFFRTAEYSLEFVTEVVVTRRSTGEELLRRTFRGTTNFLVSSTNTKTALLNDLRTADVNADERQAFPRVASDLAVQITSALSEGW
jgi:hypothetical protein